MSNPETGGTRSPADVAAAIFDALRIGDLEAVAALQHEDVVDDFVAVGVYRGRSAVRGFFDELFAAVPDLALVPDRIVGDEHHAVVQWHARGTFTGGPFQGVHATGRRLELRGTDVMHIVDGRLKHNTIYYDGLAFARQIGMLPAEGSRADRLMTRAFNAATDAKARISTVRLPKRR